MSMPTTASGQFSAQQQAQQLLYEVELINREYRAQVEALQAMITLREDLRGARDVLKELVESKPNDEILVQIGPTVFLEVKLTDKQQVLRKIGSGAAVVEDFEKARKEVEKQLEQLESVIQGVESRIKQLEAELMRREATLQSLAQESRR